MEYTFDIESMEHKAAELSKMRCIKVTEGGTKYTYTDFDLPAVRKEYEKLLKLLNQSYEEQRQWWVKS